jgi:hypothetical protein
MEGSAAMQNVIKTTYTAKQAQLDTSTTTTAQQQAQHQQHRMQQQAASRTHPTWSLRASMMERSASAKLALLSAAGSTISE